MFTEKAAHFAGYAGKAIAKELQFHGFRPLAGIFLPGPVLGLEGIAAI
jgi:hypothetical protein